MLIEQTQVTVQTATGDLAIEIVKPKIAGYPNARFPGVVVWSEIYNVTGPVLRFANQIAAQGFIVACPYPFHELSGNVPIPYDTKGTDEGNAYKVKKLLSATDEDIKKTIDTLVAHPNCTGQIGATGMCYGGHLAFRTALDPRCKAAVCYFATDIHSSSLSPSGDDSLDKASRGEIKGEVVMIFGTQDGHVPLAGRTLIRDRLTNAGTKLSFLELQANHAFIRDEMSKGRFDAAISKVCFELLLETFTRTIGRDLGEPVEETKGDGKLVRYRRFGDPPNRGESPAYPPRDAEPPLRDVNPNDPLGIFDVARRRRQVPVYEQPRQRSSYGGRRQGFSFHNVQTVLRSRMFLVLLGGAGGYYVFHLEKVPETGRWRFMDVSPSMEKQMGEQAFQETMGEFGRKVLPDYHPQARFVQGVVQRIIRANGLEDKVGGPGWKTYVVKDDSTKNAFVLPNGTIFVFTGILPVAADADGLACVLGHEIAHQVARHSAERMSGMKVFYALALLLSSFGIDMGLSQVLLQFVYSLPNSRKNETEADLIGLRLANQACFDPRAAEALWKRMSAAEDSPGVDMSFLSTHPSSKHRIENVRGWAEDVVKERPSECGPLRDQVEPFQRFSRARW
ncbi:metalloendopeptidase [Rhodotorula toruloides]